VNLLHMLILLVLAGIGALVFLHFQRVGPAKAAANWPTAPGVMLAAAVREPAPGGPAKYQPLVHYRYNVGGRDMEGVQLRLADSATSDRNKAYADIAPYPPGTPVQVRYNPMRPEESVLELSAAKSPFLLIAGGLLLAIVLGVGAIVAVENGLFEKESAPAPYQAPPLTMDNMSMGTTPPPVPDTSMTMDSTAAASSVNNHAASLPGRWSREGNCGRVMTFQADGTFINPNGQPGTWQVRPVSPRQSTLTISGGGHTVTAWLDPSGDSSFQVTPMDGSPAFTITRC
jgi:hypothetical protein